MNTLAQYLVNEIMKEEITVLYPGGFKPPHGGHLDLVQRYAALPNVNHVVILIGPETRDNITREMSLAVWKELTKGNTKILVQPTQETSPLTAAYKFIEKAQPGSYALASSNKEDDYNRVRIFVKQHDSVDGKYKRDGIQVVELKVDTQPLKYSKRSKKAEQYVTGKSENGKGISASVLRVDLKNNDIDAFKTNYPNISDNTVVDKIFQILQKGTKTIKEAQTTLLNEGGAAGHMSHPYEDITLTFSDIKNLIKASLSGEIEQAQEKLDGQNLMITYKDGQVRAARNKGQIKNFGEMSLTLKQVRDMFSGRDNLQAAFGEAVNDLSEAINKLSKKQKIEFFDNGKKFVNLEILYPQTQNIIPYGATQIRFHNIRTHDAAGNVVDEDTENAKNLEAALNIVQAQNQKTYQIRTTNPVTIKKSADYDKQKVELEKIVNDVMKAYKLSDTNTMQDYMSKWWQNYVKQNSDRLGYKITKDVLSALVQRWAFSNKEITITQIKLRVNNGKFSEWISNFDTQQAQATKKACINPFEILFLKLGVYVLQNIENLVTLNPDQAVRAMKKDLRSAIDQIRQAAQTKNTEDDAASISFLKRELKRLKDIGGFNAILPVEGIVFKYNNKLYKLTGAFPPVNTIMGYLKY